MAKRYITTTLPYVNANPHLGFALEIVQADFLARFFRANGDDVFFNTGSDEHGQKLYEAAKKNGQDVQAYVDHFAGEFQKLKEALNLSYDAFIRTTDPHHIKAAQEMWRICEAAGDIYKKKYTGLYCVGHESFITEKDLVDGKCPDHGVAPQLLEEENYFFRFSKYEKPLLEYLSRESAIYPDWRRKEAITFVENGLEDFPISREKARLSWGIPIPGDETQVMYVWFDALTNYISTLNWPQDTAHRFADFWQNGTPLQVAGKDQLRFQSLIFQAMLMSAKLRNTETIIYHGFINSGGRKMSKSLGNVIHPYDVVAKYGTDALRYILLRHVSPFEDSDLTMESMETFYTAHLTNGLGNLVARVLKLAETNLETPVAIPEDAFTQSPEFVEKVNTYRFNEALDFVFANITKADEYLTAEKPFLKVKSTDESEQAKGKEEITSLVVMLQRIATDLVSAMPETAETITCAIKENKKPENLFPRL